MLGKKFERVCESACARENAGEKNGSDIPTGASRPPLPARKPHS